MTLILVVPATDGIVMASDGQITVGMVRSTGQKIFRLNDRCLWAASGELALIQRVEERLGALSPGNLRLSEMRDQIGQIVKQCVTDLLQLDFRTAFLLQKRDIQPDILLQLHPGDFVFAEVSQSSAILHVWVNGTPEWITDRPFASGSGDMFAYALLQKYRGTQLDVERASLLAYKVIEEAMSVGAYGLGPPIDIWHIKSNGITQLDDDKKAALEDASRTLRESEVQALLSKGGS